MMPDNLPSIDLKGKVAIVTGGGRGLGVAMARHLATAGASVAVVGRSPQHLEETTNAIRAHGGQAIAVSADVTDKAAVERMAQEVTQHFGTIDVLVNNAGVVGTPGPVYEADVDSLWRVMEVNVLGPLLCTRAVLPTMLERKQGVIINIASGAALAPIIYGHLYCVSKAALVRLSECIAADVKDTGIAVFSLDPGTVRTDMSQYLLESEEGKKWLSWFASIFEERRDFPPEACAKLVTFLASGQANALTGRFLGVYDDATDMLQRTAEIQSNDLYTLRLRS